MKTETKTINRYPTHEKSLLHLSVIPWFKERYTSVIKEGNPDRVKKYDGMDPIKFFIEQPLALFRSNGYYHSTIISRDNGLLFPDPKITFEAFAEFLRAIDPDKEIFENSVVPATITKDILENVALSTESFPSTPLYYITKMKETSNYTLLVFCSEPLDAKDILAKIFKGYDFQQLIAEILEEGDNGYPLTAQENVEGYVVGRLRVSDVLLLEEEITVDVFNVKVIHDLLNIKEYYYNGKHLYDGKITYAGEGR